MPSREESIYRKFAAFIELLIITSHVYPESSLVCQPTDKSGIRFSLCDYFWCIQGKSTLNYNPWKHFWDSRGSRPGLSISPDSRVWSPDLLESRKCLLGWWFIAHGTVYLHLSELWAVFIQLDYWLRWWYTVEWAISSASEYIFN